MTKTTAQKQVLARYEFEWIAIYEDGRPDANGKIVVWAKNASEAEDKAFPRIEQKLPDFDKVCSVYFD